MKKRINNLEKIILEASDAYYNDQPIMSDAEFDALVDELKDIDPDNSVLKNVGAPILDSPLQKVRHEIPMGSQSKVNTKEEFVKWARKLGANMFVAQEKLDGISVELLYDKRGNFKRAVTRGDGIVGEDITHNVIRMRNVRRKIKVTESTSLRGEILLSKSDFREYFKEDYANPRNTTSGVARRKTRDDRVKFLAVFYYDILMESTAFQTEYKKVNFIKELGLKTVPSKKGSIKEICRWFDAYQNRKREELNYEIDGLVIKVDDTLIQEALGVLNDRPKGQVAWKFAAQMREAILEDVVWEVGLAGRITPVAHVQPVNIGGVVVRKASLHNAAYVQKLNLFIGCRVLMSRRGDTIPYVEDNLDA